MDTVAEPGYADGCNPSDAGSNPVGISKASMVSMKHTRLLTDEVRVQVLVEVPNKAR